MKCKTKSYKTAEANAKAWLRSKGIIDQYLNILNLPKWRSTVNTLRQHGLNKYGIEGQWFVENESGTKLIPNKQLFQQVDNMNSPVFFAAQAVNGTTEGNIDKLKLLKEQILNTAKDELAKYRRLHRFSKKNKALTKQYLARINELNELINGDDKKGVKGLEREISELDSINNVDIERITPYIESELARVEELIKTDDPVLNKEASEIIQFIIDIGTFDNKTQNPFYLKDELYDDKGNILIPNETRKQLEEWAATASGDLLTKVNAKKREIFDGILKSNKYFKKSGMTTDEVLENMKDVDWISMQSMDPTGSIFSKNGVIPQAMYRLLQDVTSKYSIEARNTKKKIDDILPKAIEEVKKIENGKYSLVNLGFIGLKGVSWDIFSQKFKNGLRSGNVVGKYSAEWYNSFSEMTDKFRKMMKEANEGDFALKKTRQASAFTYRATWFRQNTRMIDASALPEIQAAFPEFSSEFTTSNHKQTIIDEVGQKHYDKIVESQINKVEQYKVQRELLIESLLEEEGVANESALSLEAQDEIKVYDIRYSPFSAYKFYERGTPTKYNSSLLSNEPIYGSFDNTTYIPRRKRADVFKDPDTREFITSDTNIDTDYYDSDYETYIENNEVLSEFYDTIIEATTRNKSYMGDKSQSQINVQSIPGFKRGIIEIFLETATENPGYKGYIKGLSKSLFTMYENIKMALGVNNNISKADVSPITGKPNYKVNDSFITKNNKRIKDLEKVYFTEISVLGQKDYRYDSKVALNKLKETELMFLSEHLGVPDIAVKLQQWYGNTIPMGQIIKQIAQHEVAQENSFDLPKVIKLYSQLAADYAAQKELLPAVNVLKEHYEQIKQPITNKNGVVLEEDKTNTDFERLRFRAIRQIESWFERQILGNDGRKHFGLRKGSPLEDDPDILKSYLDGQIQGKAINKGDKKLYTQLEKDLRNKIDELIETTDDEVRKAELVEIRASLGKYMAASAVGYSMLDALRLKYLGWNLSSYLTNFLEGQIGNKVVAHMFPEFIDRDTLDEYDPIILMRSRMFNRRKRIKNNKYLKMKLIMDKYDILQDASNELQKASVKSGVPSLEKLNPYYGIHATEFYNQAPLSASILKKIPIKGVDENGNSVESNVLDALTTNSNGELVLVPHFNTEQNRATWIDQTTKDEATIKTGDEFYDFNSYVTHIIKIVHGDFDNRSGNMAKGTLGGAATLMFKSWLPRALYQRYAPEQYDLMLGENFKGRHRSATKPMIPAALGATALFAWGIPGMGIATAAGIGIAHFVSPHLKVESGLSYAKELMLINSILLRKIIGNPINLTSKILLGKRAIDTTKTITGKSIDDYFKLTEKFTQKDLNNYKSNMEELGMILSFIGMILLTKAVYWDDDEPEEDMKAHNFLVNRFMQLASQSTMYTNPLELTKTVGGIAPLRFFTEVGNTIAKTNDLMYGYDTNRQTGSSKFWDSTKKAFLPRIFSDPFHLGLQKQMESQFQASPFDKMFYDHYTKLYKKTSDTRSKVRAGMRESGYDEKYINKYIKEHYPYPDKEAYGKK